MAGSWRTIADEARFTPRFPPVRGADYVVVERVERVELLRQGDAPASPWRELARLTIPPFGLAATTVVETIDPDVAEVPANLLRFAVTFSNPMEEGSAAGHLHLLDESGTELGGSLLGMPPELWDRPHRRLTALVEPGRLKRGLQPNVQAGAPLGEGDVVTLVVDAALRDSTGAELAREARRTFRVGPAVRSRVDPARWELRWPSTPGAPLVVRFDRPLDRALVERCLRVRDGLGHPTLGRSLLQGDARTWVFTPAADPAGTGAGPTAPPAALPHALHVDTTLEDLAGNSVRRVFDRDLGSEADDGIAAAEVVLTRVPICL
ncbi:hypothetical protein [Frondihabitans cladoniiphilus]|uniref:SbsA Ig-like domain-containing protein n=1 Tax=Frondihabitans cladoniiphilus TaxID=715785 RepID=A0ABP8VMD4_9MICO